jgi:hypothetical protein
MVAPAAMSGRGRLWSEVAGPAHTGTLVGTLTSRLTVALGAAARDSAAFCPGKPWVRILSNPLQRLFLAIECCMVDLMSESVSPSNQDDPTALV